MVRTRDYNRNRILRESEVEASTLSNEGEVYLLTSSTWKEFGFIGGRRSPFGVTSSNSATGRKIL
jgi:hypothetical protein